MGGTFGKSARFQVPKNGTSSAHTFERTPKTPRNTPQNGGVDIWIMHFHFRASMKPNFENCLFQLRQELFYHYHKPKHKNRSHNVVYGSIMLKFCLWAPEPNAHQWLSCTNAPRQKCFFGTP